MITQISVCPAEGGRHGNGWAMANSWAAHEFTDYETPHPQPRGGFKASDSSIHNVLSPIKFVYWKA